VVGSGIETSSSNGGGSAGSSSATSPAAATDQAAADGPLTVESIRKVLQAGFPMDGTTHRIVGNADTPEFHVQLQHMHREAVREGRIKPQLSDGQGWYIKTPSPVRTTPATFSGWTTNSSSDYLVFAEDTIESGLGGITSGASPSPASTTDIFLLNSLYATASAGPNVAGSAGTLATHFALGNLFFSFDSANLRIFALSFGSTSAPVSGGGAFCFNVPAMTACTGWSNPNKVDNNNAATVTFSSLYPVVNNSGDVTRLYWGDDRGRLNCLVVPPPPAGGAPSICTGYTPNGLNLGGTILGPPVVNNVSTTLADGGTTTEYDIYVGDRNGNVYFLKDVGTGAPPVVSANIGGSSPANRIENAPVIDLGTNHWYIAADGHVYEFTLGGVTQTTNSPASLPLTSGSWANPIVASPFLDNSQTTEFVYVAGANNLYKVQVPLASVHPAATATALINAPTASTTIDAQSVNLQSMPVSTPGAYFDSSTFLTTEIFVGTGKGGTAGTTGGLEAYGCVASAVAPVVIDVTNPTVTFGGLVETGEVLDWENGNLYFGFDTGTTAKQGGLAQYPLPTTGWACPTGYTSSPTAACGSAGCVIATASCSPANNSIAPSNNCSTASLPVCNTSATCVQCGISTQCPGIAACDTTGTQTCVCISASDCPTWAPTCGGVVANRCN
jgi:hypothetical protein